MSRLVCGAGGFQAGSPGSKVPCPTTARWDDGPTDAFFRWLPLMNIGWVAGIALNLVHLRTGRWTPVTRAASIAVSILQLVILVLLITGPDIVALTPELLTGGGFTDPGAAETVVLWVGRSIRIGLAFGILGTTVEIVQGIVRLVRAGISGRLVP